ncbi:RNA-directed DNA polymerase (Reverse transcriptase), Ribonuclease H [Gossypium australe]|uniref:RNA-directed DNA polymerase (Reverse transcriptase), Ribonuclease H n=1 Tax=Gossypium australe TaxID=47621 RepID=A0A5B6WDR7_9ROSI|nr:RNA-directed DNA polymerase (Reverse transcriptase), Ribonuclease H [Gossypium australe]
MSNWERPYATKKACSGEAWILTEMNGKDLPNPVNSDSIKSFPKKKNTKNEKKEKGEAKAKTRKGRFETKGDLMEQTEDSRSCLPEIAVKRIEDTSLASLSLQWSRLKIADLIFLRLHEADQKHQPSIPEFAVDSSGADQLKIAGLISRTVVKQIESHNSYILEVPVE